MPLTIAFFTLLESRKKFLRSLNSREIDVSIASAERVPHLDAPVLGTGQRARPRAPSVPRHLSPHLPTTINNEQHSFLRCHWHARASHYARACFVAEPANGFCILHSAFFLFHFATLQINHSGATPGRETWSRRRRTCLRSSTPSRA